jgi:hypothetical protein
MTTFDAVIQCEGSNGADLYIMHDSAPKTGDRVALECPFCCHTICGSVIDETDLPGKVVVVYDVHSTEAAP